MDDKIEARENLEQAGEEPEYEAPKLEVLGTVEQLTSEFDTTAPPR
jgi:hypothetical protein